MSSINGVTADQLRSIVERIERLNEEDAAIKDDKKELFAEATANGYCAKTLRKIVSLRKIEPAERQEQEDVLDTYMAALGMIPAMRDAQDAGERTNNHVTP